MTDHYATLGVPRDASTDAIVRAWRAAASMHHPDKVQGEDAKKEAANKFRAARAAFDCLMDRQARAQHDSDLSGDVPDGGALTQEDYDGLKGGELTIAGGTQCPICLDKREVRLQQSGFWLRKPCPACT